MFRVEEEKSGNLRTIKIKNADTGEYVSCVPQFGANVNEIVLSKNKKLYPVLQGNLTLDDFTKGSFFTSANLIPFPNRIKDGTYEFGGKHYKLGINRPKENNAIHGLVFDKEFKVEESKEEKDKAFARLVYKYDGSLPGYPFPYRAELTYTLGVKEGFSYKTEIENLSDEPMPLGYGWHPYFTFGKKVDELFIKFPAEQKIVVDERMTPTGDKESYDLFEDFKKIGDTKFDTCFKIKSDGIQSAELYDKEKDVKIGLWMETGKDKYNYLQIYIPRDRNSIALEPMTCNVDAFNNREGLIALKENDKFVAECGVKLS